MSVDPVAGEWSAAVKGRPLICRQSGCGEPAVDDRQLCRAHWWSQAAILVNKRRRAPVPPHIKPDIALGASTARLSGPWAELAACRDSPGGDLLVDMFPTRGGRETATAKAICAGCPVRRQCLSAGRYEEFGIWGGLTAQERRRLPHRWRSPAC
ncbi:MAG: WhiB family transcriptional regulator [Acidimicrobiales bacterium]